MLHDPFIAPETPVELTTMLVQASITRAYGDITLAARRGRLTEHDIARIERSVLDLLRGEQTFAHEFPTFEVEPAVAKAREFVKEFFAAIRAGRQKNIAEKP